MQQMKAAVGAVGAQGTERQIETIKILLLGDMKVGKTSLVNCLEDDFSSEYYPTSGAETTLLTKTYNREVNFEVVDAGNDARYVFLPFHRDMFVKSTHAFVFCFDLTDVMSFKHTTNYYEMIPELWYGCPFPVFLVGLKSDLKHQRKVLPKAVETKAELWGCPYIEISSKRGENVDDLFFRIFLKVEEYRQKMREANTVTTRVTRAVKSYFNFAY